MTRPIPQTDEGRTPAAAISDLHLLTAPGHQPPCEAGVASLVQQRLEQAQHAAASGPLCHFDRCRIRLVHLGHVQTPQMNHLPDGSPLLRNASFSRRSKSARSVGETRKCCGETCSKPWPASTITHRWSCPPSASANAVPAPHAIRQDQPVALGRRPINLARAAVLGPPVDAIQPVVQVGLNLLQQPLAADPAKLKPCDLGDRGTLLGQNGDVGRDVGRDGIRIGGDLHVAETWPTPGRKTCRRPSPTGSSTSAVVGGQRGADGLKQPSSRAGCSRYPAASCSDGSSNATSANASQRPGGQVTDRLETRPVVQVLDAGTARKTPGPPSGRPPPAGSTADRGWRPVTVLPVARELARGVLGPDLVLGVLLFQIAVQVKQAVRSSSRSGRSARRASADVKTIACWIESSSDLHRFVLKVLDARRQGQLGQAPRPE
jgi:hypothetical protein